MGYNVIPLLLKLFPSLASYTVTINKQERSCASFAGILCVNDSKMVVSCELPASTCRPANLKTGRLEDLYHSHGFIHLASCVLLFHHFAFLHF